MKKKLVLLTAILSASTVAVVAATGLIAFNGDIQLQGQEQVNKYTVDLKTDADSIVFDEENYWYELSAKGELTVGSTKYEIKTEDVLTSFYSWSEPAYVLDDSYFIKFPKDSGFSLDIVVPIISRATFNFTESKIVAHVENTENYFSSTFEIYDDEGDYTYYYSAIDGYSHHGTVIIDYVRLVFSCVA